MILVLGGTGYVGQAFCKELADRHIAYTSQTRALNDYTKYSALRNCLRNYAPSFVINCAGYVGIPNVDACESNKIDTFLGNAVLPQTIALACSDLSIPFGHVSSGCIYSGDNGGRGFSETDKPNFCFSEAPPGGASFYSGTKAVGEEAINAVTDNKFIWRLRIPFDEIVSPRNYITKMMTYDKIYNNINSLSHRSDFVKACLDLYLNKAPYGTYNVTNPGAVTSTEVLAKLGAKFQSKKFNLWASDEEFYEFAKTPRSNCVLNVDKLLTTGVKMRSAEDALDEAIARY